MKKRQIIRLLVLLSAIAVSVVLVIYVFFVPRQLRIGVSPKGSESHQVISAIAAALERDKAPVRLRIVNYPDRAQTAEALSKGSIDLAVLRPDLPLPSTAQGVAVANEFLIAVAVINGPAKSIVDLKGLSIGVMGIDTGNQQLFERLAKFYGLSANDYKIVPLASVEALAQAARENRIDAFFIAAPPTGRTMVKAWASLIANSKKPPRLLAMPKTELFVARNQVFDERDIAVGELLINPPFPAKATHSLSFPALIVAHADVESAPIYELTKRIFAIRQGLAVTLPLAAGIAELTTDRDDVFPVHPGAATYYDASETSWIEKYGELLWLPFLGIGSIVSLAIWLLGFVFPGKKENIRSEHEVLVKIMSTVHAASTPEMLEEIESRIDQVVGQVSQAMLNGDLAPEKHPAFDILVKRLQVLTDRRRLELAEQGRPAPATK